MAKRIIPDALQKREKPEITVERVSSADGIMNMAMNAVSNEVLKISKASAEQSAPLSSQTARVLQGYVDSLARLIKEQRESSKSEDYSDLTDEEIRQMAEDQLKEE